MSKVVKKIIRLITGKDSSRVRTKLCQWVVMIEKSENIKEKNWKKPDCINSALTVWHTGRRAAREPKNPAENMKTLFLIVKSRLSL